MFPNHKYAIVKSGDLIELETKKVINTKFAKIGKDGKTIQEFDYLPKSLAPNDSSIYLMDTKYIIVIYHTILEVWEDRFKFSKVITWGINLIVVTTSQAIFIYSVTGELLKKLDNYIEEYDIYQTIVLPNGRSLLPCRMEYTTILS